MDEKRFVVALFGLAVASVAGYVAYRFVAPLTVAVFLYYSTRRFYHQLERFRLPARVRAVVSLSVIGVPLIGLVGYTLVLLVLEARRFIETYPVADTIGAENSVIADLAELSNPTTDELLAAYRSGQFDPLIDLVSEQASLLASTLSGLALNLLITVVVTYYLLIDGSRFHDWLLTFDDDAVVREYLETADDELEAVLYGNLLNVIAIAIIAVVTYLAYNAIAPAAVEIPYPTLAGALTGVASLIPVIGMKIVYVPLAAAMSIPVALDGDVSLLAYVAGFLAVAAVIVDTIPDIVLRPYFSGETTHVGLLMLAYIFGPVVFGFHGLFLAPIVLVLALTFADTALLRLLGVRPDREPEIPEHQRRLDEF
ncbi:MULTISPECIES: AI-2E family transporter [Halorubrum]|uniref:Predicted PurR-regulated permease PerM n=1 Tax=Halorubrum sodomense TaxID=35743 RepID=A0A1I6G9T2_HALSD|nr:MULTISPECIES: AI-2E family transporter [Halorubrum]TKX69373.1 AI-2E family transporter [Halorubrum sp. SP9]SFR38944.1 Predicted PurR-regulated permease PerM [Halorubrum sodomense]